MPQETMVCAEMFWTVLCYANYFATYSDKNNRKDSVMKIMMLMVLCISSIIILFRNDTKLFFLTLHIMLLHSKNTNYVTLPLL